MAEQFQFGDIVLIEYPFSDGTREKLRPALVLSFQEDGDLLLAHITTKAPKTGNDIAIEDWRASNLMRPSTVRTEKLSTLLMSRVKEKIGILFSHDRDNVWNGLREFIEHLKR